MRTLITGGGMLGSALRRAVEREGWEVRLLGRPELDVTDRAAVLAAVEDFTPELILHTAALTRVNYCEEQPQEAQRVNAEGCANIAAAARESVWSARLVSFSTDYVFPGGTHGEPIEEMAVTGPLNAYGASKLAGEAAVLEWEQGHVVRVSGVFGPRPDGSERNFVRAIAGRLREEPGQIQVVDDQWTCLSYAPHIATMVVELLDRRALPRLSHLTSAGAHSWYEWAQRIAMALGDYPQRIERIPTPADGPVRRPLWSVLGTQHSALAELVERRPAAQGLIEYCRDLGF